MHNLAYLQKTSCVSGEYDKIILQSKSILNECDLCDNCLGRFFHSFHSFDISENIR